MVLVLALLSVAFGDDVRIVRMARGYVNVWAVVEGDHAILVDSHYARSSGWLARQLDDEGIDPHQVGAIVLTHGHGDHAGGATALKALTGAPIVLGEPDVGMAAEGRFNPYHATSLMAVFLKPSFPKRFPAFTPDVVVTDRLDLRPYGIAGEAEIVGGHTPGSLVVRLDSGDLLIGDLVRGGILAHHHPREHLFQPDVDDVHARLRKAIDGAVRLYPGHGDELDPEDVRAWLDRKD